MKLLVPAISSVLLVASVGYAQTQNSGAIFGKITPPPTTDEIHAADAPLRDAANTAKTNANANNKQVNTGLKSPTNWQPSRGSNKDVFGKATASGNTGNGASWSGPNMKASTGINSSGYAGTVQTTGETGALPRGSEATDYGFRGGNPSGKTNRVDTAALGHKGPGYSAPTGAATTVANGPHIGKPSGIQNRNDTSAFGYTGGSYSPFDTSGGPIPSGTTGTVSGTTSTVR